MRLAAGSVTSVPVLIPIPVRGAELRFGTRTFVMGILNVTPDSFSGDGLLAGDEGRRPGDEGRPPGDTAAAAVERARRMVADGVDIIDIGGESTRPGHAPVAPDEEARRVLDVVAAVRSALPAVPISIDTRKPEVAEAALDAGADLLNDVGAVTTDAALAHVAATRGVPYVMTHDRAHPASDDIVADVVADLDAVIAIAVAAGCRRESLIVDPGFGFGKDAAQNLALLRDLARLRVLGLPILLGASRKSTIGRVLDLPAEERLEGTIATTVLGIVAGADVVRVHDVGANVRAARMADAVVRGWHPADRR